MAIAISPLPIIAVILMLMSPRAVRLGSTFAIGWIAGIAVAVTLFTLLADAVPSGGDEGPQPILGVVQLLLGVGLLGLGWRQWRSRPAAGERTELPGWMSRIDQMSIAAALGMGLALSALNPKNLLAAAAAGANVGRAGLDPGQTVSVLALFCLVAATTVLIPTLLAVLAPSRTATALGGLRDWLAQYNTVIMVTLLVFIGVKVLGEGIGAFQ